MDRRNFLGAAGLSAATLLASRLHSAETRPNIVILYADDLGYGDVGCNGAVAVKTPNIDRLARQGLRFTAGHCPAATCTPSRYSLLSGEYAFRRRGTGVLPGDAALIVPTDRSNLPALLKQAGYATGAVGKWHLGLGDGQTLDWNAEIKPGPREVGFDYSFVMAATGDRVPCVFVENQRVVGLVADDPLQVSYKQPFPGEPTGVSERDHLKMDWSAGHNMGVVNGIGRIGWYRGGRAAQWKDEDMADTFTAKGVEFMERNRTKPFFLYFATHDIHVPRVPHPRFQGATTMGPRGDAIVEFDACVGTLLDALERLGLSDNTLVILSSDNGPVLDDGYRDGAVEKLGDHKPAGPFRGGKYTVLEGGTREPFIVRWPARVKPGVSDAVVSQVDFCASLSALVGAKLADNDAPDSLNVLPALLGESRTGREWLLSQNNGGNPLALKRGDWKLIVGPGHPKPGTLYNLKDDIGETRNVAADHPEIVAELAAKIEWCRNTPKTRP
ncbi:MAG: arylsulfatase [Armatimonadetes bacterium]|nr:arylsulfatase [Armatimonadota bacterium]